jgi:ABC-type multidrug transport system permease subunit
MRFLGLASRNFKETYRDRLDIVLLFAIPIMLMIVFGVILRNMTFFVEEISFIDFMAPGAIVFGLLILVSASARLMAMDKETGFLSRLMTTPARPSDFLLGYSLGLVAIVIVQIIIYIAVGWGFGMKIAGSPWLLFLILFLTSLNCIAIGMIVASLAKSKAQADNLSWLFILPVMLLSGAMFPPLEMMPSTVANIAYSFPFARAIDAARGVNIKGLGLEALSNDLLFLAGFALVFFVIGVILFRNCLVVSRIRSLFSYIMAVVILAGLLGFGFFGGDLRFNNHVTLGAFETPATPEATPAPFSEDFEDGNADGWSLDTGWEVKLEGGNYVLSGTGDRWSQAKPEVDGWFDYTLESRVKLLKGIFQVHFRMSEEPFLSRYMLGIGEEEFWLNRGINEQYTNLTGGPPILELNEWHRLKVALNGTNIKVYLDDTLKLDYTDNDLPLIFGGISFHIGPDSHALFDDINVQVAPTPFEPQLTEPASEVKEYVNETYDLSIKYPRYYLEERPTDPECVFQAVSSARSPIPLPELYIFVEDAEEDMTFAELRELTRADFETFGGKDIEFISEKETTLADGTTPAHELVLEWSVAGSPRLKSLILSVIKESKLFSVMLVDVADYWPDTEAEILEIAYSLAFR